jgi:hypothetical protein
MLSIALIATMKDRPRWLPGAPARHNHAMSHEAKIGFHAASLKENGQVTSAGNALVGAYLNQLGLPTAAVVYITEVPPDQIRWMTGAEAQAQGIEVKELDLSQAAIETPPPSPQTQSPQLEATTEDKATRFLVGYFNGLSHDTNLAMKLISSTYASSVVYYSHPTDKAIIEREKLSFFLRWPEHKYVLEPSSLKATCIVDHCEMIGIVFWQMHSSERNVRSDGASSIDFGLSLAGPSPTIVSESSKVISRGAQHDKGDRPH